METYAIWRSRPVFITSTFRDMHAEIAKMYLDEPLVKLMEQLEKDI